MKIEGSAFRLGGGPGLANRYSGGVPIRCFAGLLTVLVAGFFEPACVLEGCRASTLSSSTPSRCGRSGFNFGNNCEVVDRVDCGFVAVRLELDVVVILLGPPPVRALNLSSLSRNDLSAAGFSCRVTASGGLAMRGAEGDLRATEPGSLC